RRLVLGDRAGGAARRLLREARVRGIGNPAAVLPAVGATRSDYIFRLRPTGLCRRIRSVTVGKGALPPSLLIGSRAGLPRTGSGLLVLAWHRIPDPRKGCHVSRPLRKRTRRRETSVDQRPGCAMPASWAPRS